MSRARGWLYALAAVLTVSPDSMLLHFMLLYSPCSAVWETIPLILFLKYSVMGFIQVGYSVVQAGSPAILLSQVKQSWRALLLPSIFMLICQLGLTTCFMTTTAANAIMLFNLQPVWALGMGRYFLGDTAQPHTLVAMAVALSAVFLAFAPLAMSGEVEAEMPAAEGAIPRTLFGDVVALLVGVSLASYLVAYRASSMSDPEAPLSIAPALGSLGASLVAAPAAIAILVSKGAEGSIGLSSTFVLATLVDAILEAYYDIAMGLASEDITSAEVAMMMLLEIPLGPLFCYWAFREVPATWRMRRSCTSSSPDEEGEAVLADALAPCSASCFASVMIRRRCAPCSCLDGGEPSASGSLAASPVSLAISSPRSPDLRRFRHGLPAASRSSLRFSFR